MKYLIKTFIAVDPGYSGSIVVYNKELKIIKNPKTFPEMLNIFREIKANYPNILIVIEKVGMNPDDMKEPGKAFGIDKMVRNYNDFINSFDALQLPYIKVHPKKWQGYLNLYEKGEEKKARKKRYKAHAQTNFPKVKVTLVNQDSLCMLLFLGKLSQYDRSYISENCENVENLVRLS